MPTESAMVNGLKLVYERDGSGPPIVFIHGFNGSAVQWESVIPFLIKDYTCIAVELRGHGRSDRAPDGAYITEVMNAEATAFIHQVVGEPAVLVGQSMGGLIAFAIAARRPELVRAVYSEDAVPILGVAAAGDAVAAILAILGPVGVAVAEKSEKGLSFSEFASRLADAFPEWASNDPAALVRFARLIQGSDPAIYATLTDPNDPLPVAEARAIQAAIRCPIHVARADLALGAIVTEEHITELERDGLDVTSTYFPGAGHIITATQAKGIIDDLRAFLQRVEAATPAVV